MGDGANMFHDANCAHCDTHLGDIRSYEEAICLSCEMERDRNIERERAREEREREERKS